MFTIKDITSHADTIGRAPQPALNDEHGPSDSDQTPAALSVSHDVGLFQDIPGWIWRAYLSAWATIFGLFLVVFTVNAEATFVVVVAALTGLMAFGLPVALVAQSGSGNLKHEGMVETHTGPLTVWAAAAQIILIPVGGIVGLTGFIIFAM